MHVFQRTIVDEAGNVIPSALVTVKIQSSGAFAAIYEDVDGEEPMANPATADSSGFIRFYAASGQYQITASSGDASRVWEHEDIGISGTADEVGRVLYARTAAEIAASVTPKSYQYPHGHVLRYIPQSEHAAILAGTSTYDASSDCQDWLDALVPGSVATIVGTVRAQGLTLLTSQIEFAGAGWIAPVADAGVSVLKVGNVGVTTVTGISGSLRVGDLSGGVTSYPLIRGIELSDALECDLCVEARGIGTGLYLSGRAAYNQFRVGKMVNNVIGIRLAPVTSYANQNLFLGGRFALTSGQWAAANTAGLAPVSVSIEHVDAFIPNANTFIGASFETNTKYIHNAGQDNSFLRCRYESPISGTAGTDFPATLISTAGPGRNVYDFSYGNTIASGAATIDHGAGTVVANDQFTVSGDVRSHFHIGAQVAVTISGTIHALTCIASTFSDGLTTVFVNSPVITGNPTAVVTPRVTDTSTTYFNKYHWPNAPIPGFASMQVDVETGVRKVYNRSQMYISGAGVDYPALTLRAVAGDAEHIVRIVNTSGAESAYTTGAGYSNVTRFAVGSGKTPSQPRNHVADPTGGTTTDAEARTAINAILATLEAFGLHLTS